MKRQKLNLLGFRTETSRKAVVLLSAPAASSVRSAGRARAADVAAEDNGFWSLYAFRQVRFSPRLTPRWPAADTRAVRRDPAGLELLTTLLVGWGVNILTLMVVDSLFDSVTIGRWGSLLLGAAVLGIANAVVKPALTVLALPLIIVTFGIAYFAINVGMLALAEWVAPDFSIDGFWTYVGATIMVWLVNWIISAVIGMFFGRRSGGPVARLQY